MLLQEERKFPVTINLNFQLNASGLFSDAAAELSSRLQINNFL